MGKANLRRTVATLWAAGALLVTAGAAPAVADGWSDADPAGDMVRLVWGEDESDYPYQVAAPDQSRGDIRSIRVAHNATRIGIRFSVASALRRYSFTYTIRTTRGDFYLSRGWQPGGGGTAFHSPTGGGAEVACPGLDWTIDWDIRTVAVSIPRRCIGNPGWVRVGLNVVSTVVTVDGAYQDYADEPLREGAMGQDYDPRLSPRIHR